ncbi:MAG: hypothetical protein ACK5M7_16550 [Draconibacterium sp.]
MKKPILLNKKDLLEPINQAIERIENIRIRKATNDDSIILEGLLALAVSSFENSIFDTMRILFTHIPEKMEMKNESIAKEELLNGNPIAQVVERKVLEQSYKNAKDFLTYFIKVTGIKVADFFESDDFANLIEIKATRNLLIHNNLKVNSFYKENAGRLARIPNGSYLIINQDYLFNSIVVLKNILTLFKAKLNQKYKGFTRLKALKELFDFTFSTPIMNFENEWEVDKNEDRIIRYKEESSRAGGLSSSERMLFEFWLCHVRGMGRIEFEHSFFNFSRGTAEKFGYLVKEVDLFRN